MKTPIKKTQIFKYQ